MKTTAKAKRSRPRLTDALIESGADLSAHFQNPRAAPPALASQLVNVEFPEWVVASLDREASRIGVPRQSLIKLWIVERLEGSHSAA